MFCKYCGNELPEGTTFCLRCGKDDSVQVVGYSSDTQKDANNDVNDEKNLNDKRPVDKNKDDLSGSILKFSILGLAFSLSFWLSLLGLIFSIISRMKLRVYIEKYGNTEGRATVGKHIGLVGLITNIFFSAVTLVVLLIPIFMGMFKFI